MEEGLKKTGGSLFLKAAHLVSCYEGHAKKPPRKLAGYVARVQQKRGIFHLVKKTVKYAIGLPLAWGYLILTGKVKDYREYRARREKKEQTPNFTELALDTDWRNPPKPYKKKYVDFERLVINWVVPTIGESGGCHNIFRFTKYLANRGHKVRVYEMPVSFVRLESETREFVANLYGDVGAEIYAGTENMTPSDVTFATSWHTAYPVFNFPHTLKKLYFVQDFEPYFMPIGSGSTLAENTYRFGFQGFTAGRWLSEKLFEQYRMECEHYDLAVNHNTYFDKGRKRRDAVFFYARPGTPRRAFELGVKALGIFSRRNPRFKIILAGQNLNGMSLGFSYVDVGYIKDLNELNNIYNRCAVALVLSLTNCSLLPLEIAATGCPVVTNYGENNEKVLPKGVAFYTHLSSFHLAEAMEKVVRNQKWDKLSRSAEEATRRLNWEDQERKLENIIKTSLKNDGYKSLRDLKARDKGRVGDGVFASVVVLTLNEEKNVKDLLEALFRQRTDFRYEVIVIDSGSKDKTVEIAKKYPIRLFQIPTRRFNHGETRNLGASLAGGKYVAFISCDAVPADDYWLQRLVEAFYLDEKVGAVYGRHIPRPECDPVTKRDMIEFFASMSPSGEPTIQEIVPGELFNNEGTKGFFSDVNSCLKKSVWSKIRYPRLDCAEDQAMGRAVLKAGYKKVYDPWAAVIHSHTESPLTYFRRRFDEFLGLKKVIGHITTVPLWMIPIETLNGAFADARYIVNQQYTRKEKIGWVGKALLMNFFRRLAIYLAANEDLLPQSLKKSLALGFQKKKAAQKQVIKPIS